MSLKPILPGNLLQVPSGGTGPVILSGPVVNVPGHGWFSNLNGLVNISSGAPVNIIPPALDNLNPNVGDTITCSTGTWTGSPVGYKYQWWQFPNTVLLFETTNQFTPQAGDVGQRFYCQVEAEFPMGVFNNPTNSNVTNPVAGGFVPTDIAGCMLWLPVDAGGLGPVQLWAAVQGMAMMPCREPWRIVRPGMQWSSTGTTWSSSTARPPSCRRLPLPQDSRIQSLSS